MKSLKIVVYCMIIILFNSLHSAAIEQADLRIENTSTWRIEITDPWDATAPHQILEPNDHLNFRSIPSSIIFKRYGQWYGMVSYQQTIGIDHLVQTHRIATHISLVPSDSTLVITISTKGPFQYWNIIARLEKKSAIAKEAAAELAGIMDPLDLFPNLRAHRSAKLSRDESDRYILGLSTSFTQAELERAYNRERQRLADLMKKHPQQIKIISDAISLLSQAAENIRKSKFHIFPKEVLLNLEKEFEEIHQVRSAKESRKFSIEFSKGLIEYLLRETNTVFDYLTNEQNLDIVPDSNFEKQYVKGTLSGGDHNLRLNDWFRAAPSEKPIVLKRLLNEYKIHLMPKDGELWEISKILVEEIKTNSLLQNLIGKLKIKPILTRDEQLIKAELPEEFRSDRRISDYWDLPRIIMYVGGGKEAAQQALNEIYRIFEGREGLNRGPGFNQKVTSLIYFSQGNRDDKISQLWRFFEQPEMIYYAPDISGKQEHYHLTIPHD